ncbi:MAG: exosome complex protein Rrp42 [Nitrososphaerota archaeon]|nr:exosome complex protein Rrp42 [Nitrososphaerales archaeon]MDW8044536.1 exosome complex protein Rrp42 [Nitrososphaerota archaeon]
MAAKKSMIVERLRKAQMIECISKGKRLDGRGLLDYRPIVIETGIIEKAEGSAKVSIGNTQVIAGVKVEVSEPFPDTPNEGLLVVNAEVLPLASPYTEPGPPDEDAIELARVVDRGIRASGMIDLSKLVLVEGEKVIAIYVDVSMLDLDGNLFDATSYAVVSSLLTARIPKFKVSNEGKVVKLDEYVPLPIRTLPISVTMARIGDALIVDPTHEEELVMDARITLTIDSEGNLCAGQKGCSGVLSFEQIKLACETAIVKSKEIREIIKKATGYGKG